MSTQQTIPEIQAVQAFNYYFQRPTHIKKLAEFLAELNRDMTIAELMRAVGV